METQILKLNEPYEYIYCNGSIGLHIATLIVYEAKVNDDGDYLLETHSHPVVKYRIRPGGTVWNRAELRDCKVLCREDNKHISMDKFYEFVSDIGHIHIEGNKEEVNLREAEVQLWKFILDQNGIEIDWPMLYSSNGEQRPQVEFNIALDFKRNPEGSDHKYTCRDLGTSDDIAFHGGSSLYFYAEFDTKEDLKAILTNNMSGYYRMFQDHQFRIIYSWPEGCEFADVIDEINKKEAEIREESNDIDV